LRCGRFRLNLARPQVMGVLNTTPDSFSDGGLYNNIEHALVHAHAMVEQGADLIDVGGESTRPGARSISEAEELDRVLPLIERLAAELSVPISVDTSKPGVMAAALSAGAAMVNDVTALAASGALEQLAASDAAVCLMHMQGEPRSMQADPRYDDVVGEVGQFLREKVSACVQAGISRDRLVVDPGFGFGKTLQHNLILMRNLGELVAVGVPVLVGLSRKSMIGTLLDGRPTDGRLHGSVALAALGAWLGAAVVRVHDVGPTVDALRVIGAVHEASSEQETG
jgi:dihydropteroate synthase